MNENLKFTPINELKLKLKNRKTTMEEDNFEEVFSKSNKIKESTNTKDHYVEQKIQIYKPSFKHLDIINTYEYKESKKEINKVKGVCIMHMIPKQDSYTSNNESELIGYCDSMMCEVTVFDGYSMTYYKEDNLFDNIKIEGVDVETRVYKDLSTMFIFRKPVELMYGENTLYVERLCGN